MARTRIAVIGIACRFPGAVDYRAFWQNLAAGQASPGATPADRRDLRGRLLADIDRFDARFFGISAREARAMDPQQRLLLEEAWHAIEDAGVALSDLRRKRTSVFVAAMTSDFLQAETARGESADSYSALGAYHCILANRISHTFGFRGPSLAVDAGHASSLVALHQAIQSLATGESDYAIAAAVNVILTRWKSDSFAKARMLSPDGQCRPFDRDANGYVPAEGVAVLVLQRLADARRERASVRGVICGSAVNHSGLTPSITMPDASAQRRVIEQAYEAAGFTADMISYVEAHGTGTPAGDRAEIDGLRQAFGGRPRRVPCAIGSVKSNIGHLEAAAGMAGVIKVLLMMAHRRVPKTLNIRTINPTLPLAGSNLHIATDHAAWRPARARTLLRAGVSSFGFGGVNAHLVIEEAKRHPARKRAERPGPRLFELAAKSEAALGALIHRWRALVETKDFRTQALTDICYTLAAREAFPFRYRQEVGSTSELASRLRQQAPSEPGESRYQGPAGRRVPLPVYPFQGEPVVATIAQGAPPAGTLHDLLKTVIAAALQCEPVSIGDNDRFQEALGVDSFVNIEIVEALERTFGKLPRTLLFEHHTVAELASYLSQRDEAAPAASAAQAPAVAAPPAARPQDVAIVGLAGRFPKSRSIAQLWAHLAAGESCISEVPAERWSVREHVDSSGTDRDKSYTAWGGFLDDHDAFDPLFFRISPRQAEQMDPQQRIFLETAWAAMEDAGYTPSALPRDTGVFAGVSTNVYGLWAAQSRGPVHTPDTDLSDVANRVSYCLDLRGPSISVDTACSASLTAMHLAVQSLQRGECAAAFVGGVNLTLHPHRVLQFCRKEMLLHGSDCHPFGAGDGGFVDGEGVAVVLLKPLAAAIGDRDHIYAVIKGTAINSEGRTSGYTVPSPERQSQLVQQAFAAAGVHPRTIGYVEAHGTGTRLGDPIEIEGLTRAFRTATDDVQFCAIGSVKSSIGHLIAAAGIAGVAKVLLQFQHRMLVPSLHAERLNPYIDFASTPFVVQRTLSEWHSTEGQPRRASVSAFGSGGANAHVVLEEYVDDADPTPAPPAPVLVRLSARSDERLRLAASNLAGFLDQPANRRAQIADVAYTLRVGREDMAARVVFGAATIVDLVDQLRAFSRGAAPAAPPADASDPDGRRIPLPTYPFLRQRYWLPVSPTAEAEEPGGATLYFRPVWRTSPLVEDDRTAGSVVMQDSDDVRDFPNGVSCIVLYSPA